MSTKRCASTPFYETTEVAVHVCAYSLAPKVELDAELKVVVMIAISPPETTYNLAVVPPFSQTLELLKMGTFPKVCCSWQCVCLLSQVYYNIEHSSGRKSESSLAQPP